MRTDPVVSVICLLLAPVADELMKLGCQDETGVTHAGTFHFKFMFDSLKLKSQRINFQHNHRRQKDV